MMATVLLACLLVPVAPALAGAFPATGQTAAFAADKNNGAGLDNVPDDGTLQRGKDLTYKLLPDGTIKDKNTGLIWEAARVSGGNALIGLLVGTALGVGMSFLLGRFRLVNDLMTPLAIALNAVPIFVLVAVFNNMFSITSEVPRRLMVTLVLSFILLVNVARGLREVDPTQL